MSKDKIEVNMNVYDIPILVEVLEKANKEIERLNNIINKIDKMLEADTNCENIYYAIGVLLNKRFFDIKIVDNEELLDILEGDKE